MRNVLWRFTFPTVPHVLRANSISLGLPPHSPTHGPLSKAKNEQDVFWSELDKYYRIRKYLSIELAVSGSFLRSQIILNNHRTPVSITGVEHSTFPTFHHPGLELPFVSLIIGMHSGQAILWTCTRLQKRRQSKGLPPLKPTPDNLKRRKAVAWIAGILWLGILLPGNIIVAAFEFGDTGRHIQTIAACVAPLGVWLRWYLSRFNGSVLKGSPWEWVPWGTLAANLLASVLVTVDKVADVQVRVWFVVLTCPRFWWRNHSIVLVGCCRFSRLCSFRLG